MVELILASFRIPALSTLWSALLHTQVVVMTQVLRQIEEPETASGLYEQLSDRQRMSVMAAFAIIVTATGFLILFILLAGRITRWYVNRPLRATKFEGDPFAKVIDSKPRLHQRESRNWRRT